MTTTHSPWRKSSRSPNGANNCVQARVGADASAELSDSKTRANRIILELDRPAYVGLVEAVKSGELDLDE